MLWAPLLAYLLRQKVHLATVVGAVVAMVGIVCMEWQTSTWKSGWGNWLALFAAMAFAVELLRVSRFAPKDRSLQWTTISCLCGPRAAIIATLEPVFKRHEGRLMMNMGSADVENLRNLIVMLFGCLIWGVSLGMLFFFVAKKDASPSHFHQKLAILIFSVTVTVMVVLLGALPETQKGLTRWRATSAR